MEQGANTPIFAEFRTRGTINASIDKCAMNGHTMVDIPATAHVAPGVCAQCSECTAKLRIYHGKAMGEAFTTTCRENPPAVEPTQTLWGIPVVLVPESTLRIEKELQHMTAQQRTAYEGFTLNEWAQEIHEYARNKGWWDSPTDRNFGDLCALLHTEISEAYEEYRNGHAPDERYYNPERLVQDETGKYWPKPEGIPSELADIMIRLFDLFGHYYINIEQVLIEKHLYNLHRPYRHGGKVS